MGNDQSRNAEELAFEIKRRRPSDAVAKVNLPSPNSPNKVFFLIAPACFFFCVTNFI